MDYAEAEPVFSKEQSGAVQEQILIRTILNEDGSAHILLQLPGEVRLQIVPDAAMSIALNMIAAVYASRSEQAIYKFSKIHNLDIKELLGNLR